MEKTLTSAALLIVLFFCPICANHANVKTPEAGQTAKLSLFIESSTQKKHNEKQPDKRVEALRHYLSLRKSPLEPFAENFVRHADTYNLDWKLLPAIAGLESSFGKRIPQSSYNAWGWGVYTPDSPGIRFQNWDHGIESVSKGLREHYLNKGFLTVEQIGKRYATSPTWAQRVKYFINQIESHYQKFIEQESPPLTLAFTL